MTAAIHTSPKDPAVHADNLVDPAHPRVLEESGCGEQLQLALQRGRNKYSPVRLTSKAA